MRTPFFLNSPVQVEESVFSSFILITFQIRKEYIESTELIKHE